MEFEYIEELSNKSVRKYNEHHDPKNGRFISGPGGASGGDFTLLGTRQEVREYAVNQLGFEEVDLGIRLDAPDLNRVMKAVTDVQKAYPETKGAVHSLKIIDDEEFALRIAHVDDGTLELHINYKRLENGGAMLDERRKIGVESGYYPPGTNGDSAIWHEYGHVLAAMSSKEKYGIDPKDLINMDHGIKDYESKSASYMHDREWGLVEQNWASDAIFNLFMNDGIDIEVPELQERISGYAKKDSRECFAEAFSEVMTSPNPRPEAVALVQASGWYREVQKSADFAILKSSDDKRLVFGWASIAVAADGGQVEDIQQDVIEPADLEEAAYEYVLHFRDTGEEHQPGYRKKGKLVESCVFTKDKQRAMGLPEGILPEGWWIGFYIEDDDAWERIKNGTYRMFSIEGRAERVPVDDVEKGAVFDYPETAYDLIEEVEKFNPYHDTKGRFTHSGGASSFTIRTRAGYQQGQANRAIEREKQKADKPSGKPLRNPTGDHKKDLKTEWENADYAVQFKSDGTSVGIIDLHSERRTGANGDESWAEGAYGNAKILTEYGSHGPIYMIDRKSAVEAEQAAYKKAKEKNIEDKGEVTKLLQDEIRQRMLRSIDKEYIDEQTKKRRQLRRQRDMGKSAGDYDLIEEVQKENKWHDPKTGRFTNKPRW